MHPSVNISMPWELLKSQNDLLGQQLSFRIANTVSSDYCCCMYLFHPSYSSNVALILNSTENQTKAEPLRSQHPGHCSFFFAALIQTSVWQEWYIYSTFRLNLCQLLFFLFWVYSSQKCCNQWTYSNYQSEVNRVSPSPQQQKTQFFMY